MRERLAARWPDSPSRDGLAEDRALALTVADGLEALAPLHRQVITLRYFADLSVRDIATGLGIPEGTVKSRLHTALATLRRRLADLEVL
ncbi:RNA polymerase sigma factor [Streptomyces polyrhachis]|uniref:RNA polymerase sigma factor n=1 Tax=Streptomyces polyrhachis TaxID=1282885 RepID=A0ABW2GEK3_9ACTN